MRLSLSVQARFDLSYTVDHDSGCWLWTKACRAPGYGAVKVDGKMHGAHRLSWALTNGAIPPHMHVLHRCDVRACVNPEHLFLGTNAENMADRDSKGRGAAPCGEQSGRAKLTEAKVAAIRLDSRKQREIAADYGVDPSAISLIKSRKTWASLEAAK